MRTIQVVEEQDMEEAAGQIRYHEVLGLTYEIIEALMVLTVHLRVLIHLIIKILVLIIQDTEIMEILVVRMENICRITRQISITREEIIGGEIELVLLEIRDSHHLNHYHCQHHHTMVDFQMGPQIIRSHYLRHRQVSIEKIDMVHTTKQNKMVANGRVIIIRASQL